jgi:MFS family permease
MLRADSFVAMLPLHRNRIFCLYIVARVLAAVGSPIIAVAVGWQIYRVTGDALALGYVGLALFVPVFFLTLPAGDVADRLDRRRVLIATNMVQSLGALILAWWSLHEIESVSPAYVLLAIIGAARAFAGPAQSALLPSLIAREQLSQAVGWQSSAFKFAQIAAPALGGFVLLAGAAETYALAASCYLVGALLLLVIGPIARATAPRSLEEGSSIRRLVAGIAYVRRHPIILGAISLDLFAVLIGAVAALLPVYAQDILHVDADGLGLMRSALAAGGAAVGMWFACVPMNRSVGAAMFIAVAIFGAATVMFGLSTNFALSIAALLVMGAADMISVVVRMTVIQLAAPDDMRGRVSSVSGLFISASNELGDLKAGVTAAWFGAMPAVVLGGVGTLLVVAVWAKLFPALRRLDRFEDLTSARGVAR